MRRLKKVLFERAGTTLLDFKGQKKKNDCFSSKKKGIKAPTQKKKLARAFKKKEGALDMSSCQTRVVNKKKTFSFFSSFSFYYTVKQREAT